MTDSGLRDLVASLLLSAGYECDFDLFELVGGANNRVHRIDCGPVRLLLKSYFHHEDDQRCRLGAEFGFLSYAWRNGITSVPRPIACDRSNQVGLYEYVDGRRVKPGDITEELVVQATRFVQLLAEHRQGNDARELPGASEACFSLMAHLDCVSSRIERLHSIPPVRRIDKEALRFATNELTHRWDAVRAQVLVSGLACPMDLEALLARRDRCISPSDFGFHNAILEKDKILRFIDFEYAGWDDPAKLVCDFFCQQQVPVPMAFFERFVEGIGTTVFDYDGFRSRVTLLLPVYCVKWCCILLNEFLSCGHSRRQFASAKGDVEMRKEIQLMKARRMLALLPDSCLP